MEIYNVHQKSITTVKDLKILLSSPKSQEMSYSFKKIKIQQQLQELNKIIKQNKGEEGGDKYQLQYLTELIENSQTFSKQIVERFVNQEVRLDNRFQSFIDFEMDAK